MALKPPLQSGTFSTPAPSLSDSPHPNTAACLHIPLWFAWPAPSRCLGVLGVHSKQLQALGTPNPGQSAPIPGPPRAPTVRAWVGGVGLGPRRGHRPLCRRGLLDTQPGKRAGWLMTPDTHTFISSHLHSHHKRASSADWPLGAKPCELKQPAQA